MKLLHVIILCLLFAFLTSFLVVNLWVGRDVPYFPLEVRSVDYRFIVNDSIGFDVGVDKLRFGSVPPGNTAFRNVTVLSDVGDSVVVRVVGPGVGLLVPDSDVVSLVDGRAEVGFSLFVPSGYPFGLYEGSVFFYIQ